MSLWLEHCLKIKEVGISKILFQIFFRCFNRRLRGKFSRKKIRYCTEASRTIKGLALRAPPQFFLAHFPLLNLKAITFILLFRHSSQILKRENFRDKFRRIFLQIERDEKGLLKRQFSVSVEPFMDK